MICSVLPIQRLQMYRHFIHGVHAKKRMEDIYEQEIMAKKSLQNFHMIQKINLPSKNNEIATKTLDLSRGGFY